MSFTLDGVSEADLKRFAACFLVSDISNTNWEEAMKLHDPAGKVKVQSFRTVTGRAIAKVTGSKTTKSASAEGDGEAPKKAAPQRKKAAAEDAGEIGEEEAEKPKAKKARAPPKKRGGKKSASSEENVVEDEEAAVKGEDGDSDGIV